MNTKLKTIILEDDMVSRMILENYCKNHPSVELIEDFDDVGSAKAFLDSNSVDLVLLDIQLKNSSGFDLLQYLPATTQVIVTTGSQKSLEEAKKLGLSNGLLKPISLEQFLWSIKNLNPAASEILE